MADSLGLVPRAGSAPLWKVSDPIREELFSLERLENHARSLAVAQKVNPKRTKGRPLAARLGENAGALLAAHRDIAAAVNAGHAITPAAEWLLDNFHLVQARIDEVRTDLPPGYYRQLPKLSCGPFEGYPRVFGLAWAFVAHTDSRFEPEMVCRYLQAYQEVQPLTIGELWAVAITLRIVLIENLRRLADQSVQTRAWREEADQLADRLLGVGTAARSAVGYEAVLAKYESTPLPYALAVQLIHRLRDQDPAVTPALVWLDQRLAAQNTSADAVVREEHQTQGAANVTVRNIITSLRVIADVDWADLFESVSLVDAALAANPEFPAMDFSTRNLYRCGIEELARGCEFDELAIAQRAVEASLEAADPRERDPGYHLVAAGRPAFEAKIGYVAPARTWLGGINRALGVGGYIGAIAMVAALLLAVPLFALAKLGLGPSLLCLLGVFPAADAAVALVNRGVAHAFGSMPLPALELREGVPPAARTLVAVPTLLTTPAAIAALSEQLEVHYLANPDGEIYFSLLTDWLDADTETTETDGALLSLAQGGIDGLNRRYPAGAGGPRFMLFHRKRVWNPSERKWIGWERKRGKLHELNRLLRGAADTNFVAIEQPPPEGVRYVITLDSDTRVPRDTLRRLIGKMVHPLNRPRFDAGGGRVVEGYAVLQPRVTPSMPVMAEGSLFQRIFSSTGGIDAYASAASDVYQDLFGEGSYAGKGIYDVDAFERALQGRVPDHTLLSHDLFEGVFARAGLASDVEFVEEYPAQYDVDAIRHHRWARGDWQLLPWILGTRGRLTGIGRWKMVDNLRRTLTPPATVLALLAGWMLPFGASMVWTGFVLVTVAMPMLIPVVGAILPARRGVSTASHIRALGRDIRHAASLLLLALIFLANQAWLMSDAIGRTLFRLYVSHRHMLEWVTMAQASLGRQLGLRAFYRRMAGAPLIGLAAIADGLLARHGTWVLAAPFAAAWTLSPAVARWTSRSPAPAGQLPVSEKDARALRLIARRTWRFFETFVTAADHMLPPDNFQEDPKPVLAHRTSPTNMGLYLLAVASARDFGWIGTVEATLRLEATLATMGRLARFRGHFYNWYDTQDLRPLDPRYVSSVDSGNLAGHLIALANACREWREDPPTAGIGGLTDTLALAREAIDQLRGGQRTQIATWQQLDAAFEELAQATRAPVDWAQLAGLAAVVTDISATLASERGDDDSKEMLVWVTAIERAIASHRRDLAPPEALASPFQHAPPFLLNPQFAAGARDPSELLLGPRLAAIEDTARSMAMAMEFGFLLDRRRKLLSIGFLVSDGILDPSCYDLLASEARLASFFAVAKGDVPARHWFRLGRPVTPIAGGAALISWSGSMFEYLMPSIVMRAPAGSLVEQTSHLIVRRQIDYGTKLGVPWGVSEAAYHVRDLDFTYQYSNFGVPGLGLKRGLSDSTVVAPYATGLAAMVDPEAAARNFERLAAIGARGRYGFYESLDYTRSRLPEGQDVAVVRAYMAHHQGMTILAIADALQAGRMRTRFHAEPIIRATELLLQERTPRDLILSHPWAAEVRVAGKIREIEPPGGRRINSTYEPTPSTLLLSNGNYGVMLTAAGSGYSRWRNLAVTRWREDATQDNWGSYIFLRDTRTNVVWSAGFQPCGEEPSEYSVVLNEGHAEFTRRDGTLTTTMEVLVSTEHDAEVRRVSLTNNGNVAREIEVTSYAELVLAPAAADTAHPAFSKMFVETEYLPASATILATRRTREPHEAAIWAAHMAVADGSGIGECQIETDRARFLGRGYGVRRPIAMIDGRKLSDQTGTVLDPIFALRRRLRVLPGATARIAFWTAVAPTRQAVLDLTDKLLDGAAFERAATFAWTQAQVELYHLGIDSGEASLFQRLAGHLIYAAPTMRPASDIVKRGSGPQSALWAHGISGDLPILLLRIADLDDLDLARQLLRAHEYWRMKQLAVDVVIINEHVTSYIQDLENALETLLRTSRPGPAAAGVTEGQVLILRADMMPAPARDLLAATARVVLVGSRGRLSDQLDRLPLPGGGVRMGAKRLSAATLTRLAPKPVLPKPVLPELEFFNGLGGFADGGREYVTILGPGQSTPAPWINVIANPNFGFQVASEGSGYTWSVSSRERQLTGWSNDPVTDRPSEAFYLRDEETGAVWTPTALPIRHEGATYIAHHGRGYSRFEHSNQGVTTSLLQYVPLADPVKISRLKLRNETPRTRRISVTAYVEWVLGPVRAAAAPFTCTSVDSETGAIFAQNSWFAAFAGRVAFLAGGRQASSWTGDRREFIGRNGTLANPAALASGGSLSNKVGAGLDPCGALRNPVELPPYGAVELVFFLGDGADGAAARGLIERYRRIDLNTVRAEIGHFWEEVTGAVQVKTPDRSMDIMLNGWLIYQTLACRVWARSAFYQASGAYGFRDQLQDTMAVTHAQPGITRAHLLRAAGRQFVQGDVQHWWLPHTGQGVRTQISDDRAWLGFAVANYVRATGDVAVLDETVGFLEGKPLAPDETDRFFLPEASDQTGTLFEHCARALDHSLAVGAHGFPLMGTGDWNDGMNRVGAGGRGESVWLGWMMYAVLNQFAPLAEARGETVRAAVWRDHAVALQAALEREAWDGNWYLRGYFDDGSPLGSSACDECRIDAIAQSWAVLSHGAAPSRAARAMSSVEYELIRPQDGLALLFTPPFAHSVPDPGYIMSYPPGVRENGGQYTHAAMWSVMALAELGQGDQAAALFSMLNPINHTSTRAELHRYKLEPYVVAADVYAEAPHVGRGGWSWYTGSAGWMQRSGIESILGVRLEGGVLCVSPCIPRSWPSFEVRIRCGSARYEVTVENPERVSAGVKMATCDGEMVDARPVRVDVADDGKVHFVRVRLGH